MNGIINALALTVEQRDPYTAGHQQRVSKLACAIAGEMGIPADQIEGIRMAGIVHDIGKMHIPVEILSRPGKLTKDEFNIVRSHAQVGYDILKGIDFPWPIAGIVHQHHELIDGSGYPMGPHNGDILLEARILCVADVVEATSSHRPYRPALGMDAALEGICKSKGICYDSDVVDACLKVIKEKGFEFDQPKSS
jgi:putative nucleotidyltransferase with HDIG domain